MALERQDPRLQPTPDYGTLGPGSDLASTGTLPTSKPIAPQSTVRRFAVLAAVAGATAALLVGASAGPARAAWDQIADLLHLQGAPVPASPGILSAHEIERLDHQSPQKQAELLLERDINHYAGADEQIARRVDSWRGHLKLNATLNSLVTTAMNSDDLRVRAAALEVDLAAMGVAKTPASVERYAADADSADQSRRVWGLWILGLLGNRGVQPDRVAEVLIAHLSDPNIEVRRWSVEGLAYLGGEQTIEPLLKTMHDDSSQLVRERAACSLAQSGMLTQEQRKLAIPRLLEYTDDASLDAATRTFAFHALRDITGQNLPDDANAWHTWYASNSH